MTSPCERERKEGRGRRSVVSSREPGANEGRSETYEIVRVVEGGVGGEDDVDLGGGESEKRSAK